LGISDMAWYYDASYSDRFVSTYREGQDGKIASAEWWSGRNPFQEDRRWAEAGTGMNGTIEGYARFLQMILNYGEFNGARILGRKTIEMMQINRLPENNSGGGVNFQFGVGFQINPPVMKGRASINSFSPLVTPGALLWGGAANTDYLIDHKEGMIVLLYTNRTPDTGIWEKFLNTVYQALE
jgi:CubicO group peptidase (beta-lactamase class C family)